MKAGRQLLPTLLLGLLLLPELLSAQTNAPKPAPGRYLFVVDTSAPMRRYAPAVRTAVGNLLRSSMGAQFKAGDTVGVWTFNDQLYAGRFPLQTWTPEATDRIASNIVSFLATQTNAGQSRFEAVVPTLQRLIQESPRLTVLLVSDGDERISGTPFDTEIEGVLAKYFRAQQKARMPFVTVLRAARGQIATATVNLAPWPVEFPNFPPEPKPVAKPKPQPKPEPRPAVPPLIVIGKKPEPPAVTNAPAATVTNAPPTSGGLPPKPVLPLSPPSTNPPPATAPTSSIPALQINVPTTTTQVVSPPTTTASPTNVPVAVRTEAGTPPATANLELTKPVPPAGASVATTTNLPPSVAITEPPPPSPTVAAGTEKVSGIAAPAAQESSPATNLPGAILVAAQVESGDMRWVLIGGGTLLVLVAAGTILLLQRRSQSASHGSLISRSMDRDQK